MNLTRAFRSLSVGLALLVLVHPVQAQFGQGEQARDDTEVGVESPAFWTPSGYPDASQGPLPVVNDRSRHDVSISREHNLPWNGSTWVTSQAELAFRYGEDQSPLEKFDTLFADRHAPEGATDLRPHLPRGRAVVQQDLDFAGAAKWEGDPRSGYNKARVVLSQGQYAQRYAREFIRLEESDEVQVIRGAAPADPGAGSGNEFRIRHGGKTYETRRYTRADGGRQYDMYYYWFDRDDQGRSPPSRMEGRFVRYPTTASQPDHSRAQWWHAEPRYTASGWTHHGSANVRVEVLAGSGASPSSGSGGQGGLRIEFGGETYAVEQSWQGQVRLSGRVYPCINYTYVPTELPAVPGQSREGLRNRFIDYEKDGRRAWVHVVWTVEEYQGDTSGFDGHCNGFAAASVMFREPREPRTIRLAHRQKVRLNVSAANAALPANTRAAELPDGVLAKPIDYQESDAEADEESLTLGVADLKGLMTAISMCVKLTGSTGGTSRGGDFGTRVNVEGPDSEAWRDVHPHHMHRILIEYLHEKGRSLVVERSVGHKIWNSPVHSYRYRIVRHHEASGGEPAYYQVEATLVWVDYGEKDCVAGPNGPATKRKDFTFDLLLDESNRVTGSRWTGESVNSHPDFLWAPVGFDTPRRSAGGRYIPNLNLDPKFLLEEVLVDEEGYSYLRPEVATELPAGVRVRMRPSSGS